MQIKWQDKIPDTAILIRAGVPSIHTILMQSQIRWAGHVVRMPEHRLPKILFYGELQKGKHPQGGQIKRYKDSLNRSLKSFGIDPDGWENDAEDRRSWRAQINRGSTTYEDSRRSAAENRRQARKERNTDTSTNSNIVCRKCSRSFKARIGLISHSRTRNP